MENKKTISCTCEEQPLPFGFLLLVANEIGEADFEFCYKKLTNWMLSDESLQSAEAWIEFEAQGNPVWWRAAKLAKYIALSLKDKSIIKIEYFVKTHYLPISDFASLALLKIFYPKIEIELHLSSELKNDQKIILLNKLGIKNNFLVNDLFKDHYTEFYDKTLYKLTGLSFKMNL